MTTNPIGNFLPENSPFEFEQTKALLLGVLQAKEKNGNYDAHCFPWASEKEIKSLSKEGLVYLNRQTEKGIYAKLTDEGRITNWVEYNEDVPAPRNPLPPKAPTMRELLMQGFAEAEQTEKEKEMVSDG